MIKFPKQQYRATKNSMSFNPEKKSERFPEINIHTLPVKVRRIFTDANGTVIAKAGAPAGLQVNYPIHLLGAFDLDSGFRIGQAVAPPLGDAKYLLTFVNGVGVNVAHLFGFSPLNSIYTRIAIGDIVSVYTDSVNAPNFFVFVIQSASPSGLGSIINNLKTTQQDYNLGFLYVNDINFFTDDTTQFELPVNYSRADNIGNYKSDSVDPFVFRTPFTEQQGFITMKTDFILDQYLGVNLYFKYSAEELSFDFKIKKVKML